MSVEGPRVFRRTGAHEKEDNLRAAASMEQESWKEWPNEAGFAGLTEHRGPIPLKVTGRFPAYAAGSLYRAGPGVSEIPNCQLGFNSNKTHHVSHWFDGFAHTHKFDILPPSSSSGDCSVTYSSRRQSDDYVEHIKKVGWRAGISFGQKADPCVGLFAKAMAVFEPKRINNNVVVLTNVPGLDQIGKDHMNDGTLTNGSFMSGYNAPPTYTAAKQNGTTTTTTTTASSIDGGKLSSGHRTSASNVWISTDNAGLQRVDPTTLEPVGSAAQSALHPDLRGPLSCAHAQMDPKTGDMFNFNLELGKLPTYRVFRTNASTGETDILATFAGADFQPAYIHSLFLTERFVVLCIPTTHFAWNGIKIVWQRNLLEAIKPFDKAQRCQWVVVDRLWGKGVVGRFTTPAGFFFHSVNSFDRVLEAKTEDGREMVELNLDHVAYDDSDIMFGFYYDIILNKDDGAKKFWLAEERHKKRYARLLRYRYAIPNDVASRDPVPVINLRESKDGGGIPVGQGEETISIPAPHAGELPTVNPLYATRQYRYAYMVATRGLSTMMDCIVKTDVDTREATFWTGGKGHTPGEAIFVPDPDGDGSEDAGVVLSMVLDGEGRKSYLVCLDAKTMEEVGRADADFPMGVGFHGMHEKVKL